MNKLALITGATSGIGEATARYFANNHIDLIICGRREDRLQKLQSELQTKVNVHTLSFDISDRDVVFSAIDLLPENLKKIDILINNAGNAHGLDPAQDASIADWEKMIDINVKGLMYVTKAVLPFMLAAGQGHIINVGSVAGKQAYANGSVYCASKSAVDTFTQGLRIDLVSKGIKVAAVHPGAVNTEFSTVRFKGDKQRADKFYEGFQPLVAEDIADIIYFMVSRPKNINIADVLIFPEAQATGTIIHKG